jgi:hypothetical protein
MHYASRLADPSLHNLRAATTQDYCLFIFLSQTKRLPFILSAECAIGFLRERRIPQSQQQPTSNMQHKLIPSFPSANRHIR